jgi:hypothetical protein
MATSVFLGIDTDSEIELGYTVENGASGRTDPVTGVAIPAKEDRTLRALFAVSKDNALIYREGADVQEVKGIVTCLDPSLFPDNTNNGTVFTMELGGVEGELTIDVVIRDEFGFIEEITGQAAKATWRPSN